jgi:hypothetical protein
MGTKAVYAITCRYSGARRRRRVEVLFYVFVFFARPILSFCVQFEYQGIYNIKGINILSGRPMASFYVYAHYVYS